MPSFTEWTNRWYQRFLSEQTKEKSEQVVVFIAIISFLLHLLVILLVDWQWIQVKDYSELLSSPIAALYTPFTFILVYEVYLLIYYLPQSMTTYVAKQYEIITLIVIRRAFKDLSNLELSSDWFQIQDDLQFTYDLVATAVLFFLIFLFYKLNPRKVSASPVKKKLTANVSRFIQIKKVIATLLVPLLVGLALYSLGSWLWEHISSLGEVVDSIKDVNNVFFDEFFTVLILVDVLLLLFSFIHNNKFNVVIRNSGFIISTILLRLSFGVEGLVNTILIIVAVLFGLTILKIHSLYEANAAPSQAAEV